MKFIRGLCNIHQASSNCVLTIGNFDGIHIGHQQLIKQVIAQANELNVAASVMIFEPQPNEYFFHEKVPPRLMRLRGKLEMLAKLGIDEVICIHFNKAFAGITANDFIKTICVKQLGVRHIVIGDDFKFGFKRQGDFSLLNQLGEKHGFTVEAAPSCLIDDKRVSSTRVRLALQHGDLITAERLLGRPFSMAGRVAHGHKRGRELGYPTANIHTHRRRVPVNGIFAVNVYGLSEQALPAVASIGDRPTFSGGHALLEVHIFDFNQQIYQQHLRIEFIAKRRDEKHYEDIDKLIHDMQQDEAWARKVLAKTCKAN